MSHVKVETQVRAVWYARCELCIGHPAPGQIGPIRFSWDEAVDDVKGHREWHRRAGVQSELLVVPE